MERLCVMVGNRTQDSQTAYRDAGLTYLENDPPPDHARAKLNQLVKGEYADLKVKSFIGKTSNGLEYWFALLFSLV